MDILRVVPDLFCFEKSGKTLQLYRGHSGPVTSLAFLRLKHLPSELLLTASWDKSICVWDTRVNFA